MTRGKAHPIHFAPHSGGCTFPQYSRSSVIDISDMWILSSTQMQDAVYDYIHSAFYQLYKIVATAPYLSYRSA